LGQTSHRHSDPHDKDPIEAVPSAVPASRPVNLEKVQHEADELSSLARTVSDDVRQVSGGMLPKDLNEKLKRIEKLSKQLRSELQLK
jgi:signal transduction histidine kinase